MLIKLAVKSLLNRKVSILLSIFTMAISIFVLLGVDHIRHQAKSSFYNTVSGIDLIVGAKTSQLNLLLYSVFRVGEPTNNLSWQSYNHIISNPSIAWSIPISLGDSHKGYRVIGTNKDYFSYFSYAQKQKLTFAKGNQFSHLFDVVLGSDVANNLHYQLGDNIVLTHGITDTSFQIHDENKFTVAGILAKTGTPIDQTLHVTLEGIEAIHQERPFSSYPLDNQDVIKRLTPKSITAFMVGLDSKLSTFYIQKEINEYRNEALIAILPGVALSQLWQMMNIMEKTLIFIAILIFISSSISLISVLLSSIRERKNEIRLYQVMGASPLFLFILIEIEALLILSMSIFFAIGLLVISLLCLKDYIMLNFGIFVDTNILSFSTMNILLSIFILSLLFSIIQFSSIYKKS